MSATGFNLLIIGINRSDRIELNEPYLLVKSEYPIKCKPVFYYRVTTTGITWPVILG